MKKYLFIVLLIIVGVLATVGYEITECYDANGQIVFTDRQFSCTWQRGNRRGFDTICKKGGYRSVRIVHHFAFGLTQREYRCSYTPMPGD